MDNLHLDTEEEIELPLSLLSTISFVEDDDTDFSNLCNEIIISFAKEQYQKQQIYGVTYRKKDNKEVWSVPYKVFRDIDKIEGYGYFTEEEKNRITEENFRMIYSVVEKYKPSVNQPHYTYEDILEACYIGFSNALVNYNPVEVKTVFNTYSYRCMSNACMDLIRNSQIKGKKDNVPASLDNEYVDTFGVAYTLSDIIEDEKNSNKNQVDEMLYSEVCEKLLDGLDPMNKFIALRYYGILGYPKMTQLDISLELNCSKSNIALKLSSIENHFKKKVLELGIDASILLD